MNDFYLSGVSAQKLPCNSCILRSSRISANSSVFQAEKVGASPTRTANASEAIKDRHLPFKQIMEWGQYPPDAPISGMWFSQNSRWYRSRACEP